jgi:Ni/Co efflux regulator RcnB
MRRILLVFLLLSAAVPAAWGKKHDRDDRDDQDYSHYRIPHQETVVVSDYYRGRSLPPGLAKKLRRGGSLPPGWEKKIQPVPVVVEQRLAPVPAGCRRGIIDGAYVVYQPNRGLIVDVVASFGR